MTFWFDIGLIVGITTLLVVVGMPILWLLDRTVGEGLNYVRQ